MATEDLLKLVKPDIDRIEEALKGDLEALAEEMDGLLIEILNYGLFGGGKRFRPLIAVVSSRLCPNFSKEMYHLSIAFEYLHLATLFHDDIIDQADTRRGKESVCKLYGITGAILAGDFLHARSMEIVGRYGVECLSVFCNATRSMVDGEFVQLRNSRNYNQSEQDYFTAIEGKTALLISAATEIGGHFGGADAEQRTALKEYGRNLGYGFQIVDDLLDYLGDEKKTGKVVGNDLAEGKMTLPLIITLQNASTKDKVRLTEILQDGERRAASFIEVHRLIEAYDGYYLTRKKAEHCINKAVESLSIFPAEKKNDVAILEGLAVYALHREK